MNKKGRWLTIGTVAALAAASLVGALVFAQGTAEEQAGAPVGETFWTRVAAELGVDVDQLWAAMTQARLQEVDTALAAGRITAQQAEVLRPGLGGPAVGRPSWGGRGPGLGPRTATGYRPGFGGHGCRR
ncbi:MAG: hypothetical protein ACP5G2_00515 [Candidatus Bipolaricaulaceae bacterium]